MTHAKAVNLVLVEDDDGHALLVEKNLRRAGLKNGFVRLRDGQEALDHFFGPGAAPDLDATVVLLDMHMPRVDGAVVLERLKSTPRTAGIPVVVLTTTDDPREIEHCYALGCNVYITKPVQYGAFIEAVRRLGLFLQVVKLPAPQPGGRP